MRLARHFGDRPRIDERRIIKRLEPGMAVGLEKAGERRHVPCRMLATMIGAVEVGGGGCCRAAERPIVADIDPEPPVFGPSQARRRHRHRRVVAKTSGGR